MLPVEPALGCGAADVLLRGLLRRARTARLATGEDAASGVEDTRRTLHLAYECGAVQGHALAKRPFDVDSRWAARKRREHEEQEAVNDAVLRSRMAAAQEAAHAAGSDGTWQSGGGATRGRGGRNFRDGGGWRPVLQPTESNKSRAERALIRAGELARPERPPLRSMTEAAAAVEGGYAGRRRRRTHLECHHLCGKVVELDDRRQGISSEQNFTGTLDGRFIRCHCRCQTRMPAGDWVEHAGGPPKKKQQGHTNKFLRLVLSLVNLEKHYERECGASDYLCAVCDIWELEDRKIVYCGRCGAAVHAGGGCAIFQAAASAPSDEEDDDMGNVADGSSAAKPKRVADKSSWWLCAGCAGGDAADIQSRADAAAAAAAAAGVVAAAAAAVAAPKKRGRPPGSTNASNSSKKKKKSRNQESEQD